MLVTSKFFFLSTIETLKTHVLFVISFSPKTPQFPIVQQSLKLTPSIEHQPKYTIYDKRRKRKRSKANPPTYIEASYRTSQPSNSQPEYSLSQYSHPSHLPFSANQGIRFFRFRNCALVLVSEALEQTFFLSHSPVKFVPAPTC